MDAASGAMTRSWVILHTDDRDEVRELLLANNPLYFQGLARKSFDVDSLGAPDMWSADVLYGVSAFPEGLKPDELSFKISAQSVHINQSLETQYALRVGDPDASGTDLTVDSVDADTVTPDGYTPVIDDIGLRIKITGGEDWETGTYTIQESGSGTWKLDRSPAALDATGGEWYIVGSAPDTNGAIGVDLDTVHGCDILVPKMEWVYSRQRGSMTFEYLRTLRSLVGRTNDAEFFGFAAGSLLYLGCEPTSAIGTLDTGEKFVFWNLAHSFAQEENKNDLKVGPFTIPQKKGWEYVWSRFDPTLAGGQLTRNPSAIYVERVYEPGNFELLEIGK
jgi:hypothetical protein